jgi:uncharacterized protein YcbX
MYVTITQLHTYPIKSCAGVTLARADVEPSGLKFDRRWMLVDAQGGFLSQRSHPAMAALRVALDEDALRVTDARGCALAIGYEETSGASIQTTVWDDTLPAAHVSEAADRFFSEALGLEARLVRLPSPDARPITWPDDAPVEDAGRYVGFADGFPSLLTTAASLDALNARLPSPVDQRRFRPNIVVSGAHSAFDEDSWDTLTTEDGALALRTVKPCARCLMVNIDPDAAASDGPHTLAALAALHTVQLTPTTQRVIFGQNCVHIGQGELFVGQRLLVQRKTP